MRNKTNNGVGASAPPSSQKSVSFARASSGGRSECGARGRADWLADPRGDLVEEDWREDQRHHTSDLLTHRETVGNDEVSIRTARIAEPGRGMRACTEK